jgi:hypothetical protein
MPTRKQKRTVRYDTSTLDKVEYVAEREGVTEAALMRRLIDDANSLTRLYREWQRIEREVASLSSKGDRALEDRHDTLMERLDDLSAAEEHLLDEIQSELRNRAESGEASVPA